MEIFNALLQIDLENFVGNILKERLEIDSFTKSDLFMAVEFNKSWQRMSWGNDLGVLWTIVKLKQRIWGNFLPALGVPVVRSHSLYYPSNCCHQGSRGCLSVSVLCFSSSFKYSHCGWLLFSSRLFLPQHPLSVATQGLFVNRGLSFLLEACRCLSDRTLLMSKLFATIGNCFYPLITQVFVAKSSFADT